MYIVHTYTCTHSHVYTYTYAYTINIHMHRVWFRSWAVTAAAHSVLLGALADGLRFVTYLHTEIYPELLYVCVRCGSVYCVYVYLFKYICIYIFSMSLGALTDGLRFVTRVVTWLHPATHPQPLWVPKRHIYMYSYMCIYMYVYMYTYVHIYVDVCMLHIHIYIYVYIYIYT